MALNMAFFGWGTPKKKPAMRKKAIIAAITVSTSIT